MSPKESVRGAVKSFGGRIGAQTIETLDLRLLTGRLGAAILFLVEPELLILVATFESLVGGAAGYW
jgi:hypothetical protein